MDFITKEDSYVERRQLFKNIWDTAMEIDAGDTEILNKPKVIKTLRLDAVDKCVGGKKKKQRIKNLRTVCNKILDFCDRQDADDIFYEQMAAEGQEMLHLKPQDLPKKPNKLNKVKKRTVRKANSMFSPPNIANTKAKATTSERKDDFKKTSRAKASRNTSPLRIRSPMISQSIKPKASPKTHTMNNVHGDAATVHRKKLTKKKHIKRKKTAEAVIPGITKSKYRHLLGRSASIQTRQQLGIPKIMIQ